jgi:hypothetical protein
MLITLRGTVIASCGFRHWKEDIGGRKFMEKFNWSIIDQWGERPLDIFRTAF